MDEIAPAIFAFVAGVQVGVIITAKLYAEMQQYYNKEERRYISFLQKERKKMQYVQYINKYPTDPVKHKDPMAHIKEEDYIDLIDPFETEIYPEENPPSSETNCEEDTKATEEEATIQQAFDGKYVYEDTPNGRVYMMHEKDHIFHYWANVKNIKYPFLNVTCRKLVLACEHKELYDEKENKYIMKGNIEELEKLKEKEDQEKNIKVRDVSFRDFISLRNQLDDDKKEDVTPTTSTTTTEKDTLDLRNILL